MAFSVAQMYPGAFTADGDFVDGKYKNSSAPGVYDGTPLNNLLFNQNLALFDALMLEANLTYNNSADIPSTSQLHKAMQIGREVSPRNNDWNGYLDPEHTVPIQYVDTSAGARSFSADTEIAPNLYVSAATNVTFSPTGISWLTGNSLYKLYDYTAEKLALIDVNTVPVYLVGQSGSEHFVNNATTGVNVSKVGGQLKVEIDFAIFAELGITALWEFFPTDRVGRVVELGIEGMLSKFPIGKGQKLKDVLSSRAEGVLYTNNTGRTIVVYISITIGSSNGSTLVDGFPVYVNSLTSGMTQVLIVPDGSTYIFPGATGSSITAWHELRG